MNDLVHQIIMKKKSSCLPAGPLDPLTSRTVIISNIPVWAKIFQHVDQPAKFVNFKLRSWAVKSQPDLLGPTDQPTQPAQVVISATDLLIVDNFTCH